MSAGLAARPGESLAADAEQALAESSGCRSSTTPPTT